MSTENNGGFIQVRRDYDIKNDNYKGIRLKARGIKSDYYACKNEIFVFTMAILFREIFVSEDWSNIEIKFDDFLKSNFYQPEKFSSSEIKSVAFVAFGKDFTAQLDIIEAELF